MAKIISNFNQIAHKYKVMFCDLWGCIHNGKSGHKESLDALRAFRKTGGIVILLTNAPRPKEAVIKFLNSIAITTEFYDSIITSGDATQFNLRSGDFGQNIFHIGPDHDLNFFNFENRSKNGAIDINLVPILKASCILCTGLFDDKTEEPSDYEDLINLGIMNNLPLLCANPDIQVDFGDQRLWCAGAIAAAYTKSGGKSIYFGKPHKPIYDLAISKVHEINACIKKSEIICIGDGAFTDILGGSMYGLDTLFVAGGLFSQDTGVVDGARSPDRQKLAKFLKKSSINPTASIGHFR